MKNIRRFSSLKFFVVAVIMLCLSFITIESKVQSQEVEPFDIWQNFSASGFMGDGMEGTEGYIKLFEGWKGNPHSAPVCIKIVYTPGPKGWGGIYWLNSPDNWGDKQPGNDFSESGYTRITFWAKGESGGEIVEFKAGGITGQKNEDSFQVTTRKVVLDKTWKKYTMKLERKDLSSVIGGFCWVANKAANPDGVIFYLDDIVYEADEE